MAQSPPIGSQTCSRSWCCVRVRIAILQPAVLRILAKSGKQVADRRASFHDHPVRQIDLRVRGILGKQTVPVASVERRKVLVEHGLRGWLFLQCRQFHLGSGRHRPSLQMRSKVTERFSFLEFSRLRPLCGRRAHRRPAKAGDWRRLPAKELAQAALDRRT